MVIHQFTRDPPTSVAGIYTIVVVRSLRDHNQANGRRSVSSRAPVRFLDSWIVATDLFAVIAAALEMVCYSSSLCRRSDAGGCGSLFLDQFRLGFLATGFGSGGRLLEWWSSGRVEVSQLESGPDVAPPTVKLVLLLISIPLLRRGTEAFIAIVTEYSYLNLLSSLLITILLHLIMSSVVLAARRAPAAEGCRPCPPYLC
ncbi:hypothetical protein BHM03_00016759 [Ensete ventricosum]|nr:hypothetical protein BHM03_00016759 [Ensete ventricosum]